MRFSVDNVFNGRHLFGRPVYDGFRDCAPTLFVKKHNQVVAPLFRLSVKGIPCFISSGLMERIVRQRLR